MTNPLPRTDHKGERQSIALLLKYWRPKWKILYGPSGFVGDQARFLESYGFIMAKYEPGKKTGAVLIRLPNLPTAESVRWLTEVVLDGGLDEVIVLTAIEHLRHPGFLWVFRRKLPAHIFMVPTQNFWWVIWKADHSGLPTFEIAV